MATTKSSHVYQLKNGNWAYRICQTINGKKIDTTSRKDENGLPFLHKRDAQRAREQRLVDLRNGVENKKKKDIKLSECWQAYIDQYSKDKATATVVKYNSLWKNHIKEKFGDRWLSEITVDDLYCYLLSLYKDRHYSYKYVESFLKLFYQLYGIAYRKERIDDERYNRMFKDKGTKLHMPDMSQNDKKKSETVRIYEPNEIKQMHDIFKRGNLYTAFLMGYYLGLRISECFGTRWSNINWKTHTITIDTQMNYEDGMFCLGAVKTYRSNRIIYIPDVLYNHLKEKFDIYNKRKDDLSYRNTEIVMDKVADNPQEHFPIQGGDFINRKENGELLTINSIKAWALIIEKETGIDFEYHGLRRTHISYLVSMNVPPKETMLRVGHKKYETTLKYYVSPNQLSSTKMKAALNAMYIDENIVEVNLMGQKLAVPKFILNQFIAEYQKVA